MREGIILRKHNLFKHVGINFEYMPRILSLYANFPNVRIGNNVIVSGRSVVNKDIKDNSVVRGFPAKRN